MRQLLLLLAAIGLVLAPALLSADGSETAEMTVSGVSETVAEGSTTEDETDRAKAADGKEEDANEPIFPATLLEATRNSAVIVRTWFRKDVTESPSDVERNWRVRNIYGDFIDKKRPREDVGVVIARGRVLVNDDGIEPRFVDRIEIETIDGTKVPASRSKLLKDVTGMELTVDASHADKLTPLTFHKLDNGVDTRLLESGLYRSDKDWRMRVSPLSPSVPFDRGQLDNAFYGYRGRYGRYGGRGEPGIIADQDGNPLGCSVGTFFDLKQTECVWKGEYLKKADALTMGELSKAEKAVHEKLTPAIHEVVLKFRAGEGGGYNRYESYGGGSGREVTAFGVAINDRDIVVPQPLDRETADQVDKMFLKHSPSKRTRLEFVGAFKDFTAFVLRLPEGKLPASVNLAKNDYPRMKPFWQGSIRRKFGKMYLDLATNRLMGKRRGYAGEYHWYPLRGLEAGEMLFDMDGKLIGMYLKERIENEEATELERGGGSYYGDSVTETRIFTVTELRSALEKPDQAMDPNIRIKPRTQARRRAWLGVEYVPISKDLAEKFKVEKATKDGQVGYVINAIYPDSPAEKFGLQVGDILLRGQAKGMPYPFEFRTASDYGIGGFGADQWWGGPRGDDGGLGPAEAIWSNRKNFLTQALDAIGVGKELKLWYVKRTGEKGGEVKSLTYTIAQAPKDLDSAQRWQNRKLGLTVKNLTYEVRHALGLEEDAPGVLVVKVESGSPTLVARIFPNEIITRMDDKPVDSPKDLRDRIAAAKKAGKEKVRLTILRLGKTRFADLQINEYDPADDEGLDEEDQ